MKYSENFDRLGLDAIDDSVAAVNHLTYHVIAEFGDHTPGKRKSSESLHSAHDALDEKL